MKEQEYINSCKMGVSYLKELTTDTKFKVFMEQQAKE